MAYPKIKWTTLGGFPKQGESEGGLHSTFLKSFGELVRRERVLTLQEKLIISRDKFQMAADASYPEVVDANRRKAKNSVRNPKGSEQEQHQRNQGKVRNLFEYENKRMEECINETLLYIPTNGSRRRVEV
jgi:hypothetical protein